MAETSEEVLADKLATLVLLMLVGASREEMVAKEEELLEAVPVEMLVDADLQVGLADPAEVAEEDPSGEEALAVVAVIAREKAELATTILLMRTCCSIATRQASRISVS